MSSTIALQTSTTGRLSVLNVAAGRLVAEVLEVGNRVRGQPGRRADALLACVNRGLDRRVHVAALGGINRILGGVG